MSLAKSAEKSLPFFKTLKKCTKKSDFQWTTEAEAAFKQMKKLIVELPILTTPIAKKELIVYLVVAKESASAVLMTEREAKQMPIYFISRALQGPEINYAPMEKLVLALVHASKRLKRYFQAHPIIVITDQPIKQVLSKPEIAERLQKWSIELGEYDIQYKPKTSVKGHILADFIVERPEDDPLAAPIEVEEELPDPWTLFTDGSSCIDGSGAVLILTNPEGTKFTYALRFRFDATNNEAEYEALISCLRIAEQMGVKKPSNKCELQLSCLSCKRVLHSQGVRYDLIPREVEELGEKSINEAEVLAIVEEEGNTWMTPIYEYLTEETLPAERKKARAVRLKSRRKFDEGSLYMHSGRGVAKIRSSQSHNNHMVTKLATHHLGIRDGRENETRIAKIVKCKNRTIEAKPVATITGNQVKKSVWDSIVYRFGLPREIISDNEKQFRDNPFKNWCEKLCIRQHFSSVKHPQANDLVERANRRLEEGIKARLDKGSKD
ncbi:reverse transcriptase domain-containing protein [Tanacetum coccineum]